MTSLLKRPERSGRTVPLRDLSAASAVPVATVSANLMPPEVLAKRRLGWLKRRLAFALVVLVALVGLGYALARVETGSSKDTLAAEQQRTDEFGQRLRTFDDVVALQATTAALRQQLATVMATDVQWSELTTSIVRAAPSGVAVTSLAVVLATPTTAGGVPAAGSATGATDPDAVGTLTVSGVARDYKTVAAYVDRLATVKGISAVQPQSVNAAAGSSTFTLTTSLTKAVFHGRFTGKGGN